MLVVSETICDFIFKVNSLNYPGVNVHDASNAFLLPLHYHDKHGMLATASEQPQRLLMTSESNSEASITYENILSWALNASTA